MHKAQPAAVPASTQQTDDLSLIRGGPFYQLQRKSRLMAEDRWHFGRRVILAIAVGWLPLVLATVLFNPHGWSVLLQATTCVYSRLWIAIPVLLIGQVVMETRFRLIVNHVRDAGLLDETGLRQLDGVIARLARLRDSLAPELIIIALAYAHTVCDLEDANRYRTCLGGVPQWRHGTSHTGGMVLRLGQPDDLPVPHWAGLVEVAAVGAVSV